MCWFSFAPKKKWDSTCWNFGFGLFLFHLFKAARHVSKFVVLQLFIFLAKFICSLFKDLTTLLQSLRLLMCSSLAHLRHGAN